MPISKTPPSKISAKSQPPATVADEFAPEVLPRSASSSLSNLYTNREFSLSWDNDVKHHVARYLLHLRRYRGESQTDIAKAMGTSQSAVARIETGEENFTANTLERHIAALRGRFIVSILPEEFEFHRAAPWWEMPPPQPVVTSTTSWVASFVAMHRDGNRALVGLIREPVVATTANAA